MRVFIAFSFVFAEQFLSFDEPYKLSGFFYHIVIKLKHVTVMLDVRNFFYCIVINLQK